MKNLLHYILISLAFIAFQSCKKSNTASDSAFYFEPSDLRLGTYSGMFQECGPVVCYNKDTTFKVITVNDKYFLVFGEHKDEIEYWSPSANEFSSKETSSSINGPIFNGYCRNDSFFVVFTTAWGIYNNNLLSGKKQN